jgi:hypothetical protein
MKILQAIGMFLLVVLASMTGVGLLILIIYKKVSTPTSKPDPNKVDFGTYNLPELGRVEISWVKHVECGTLIFLEPRHIAAETIVEANFYICDLETARQLVKSLS